jgi:hypothetical protein
MAHSEPATPFWTDSFSDKPANLHSLPEITTTPFTEQQLALFQPDLRADDAECEANPTKINRPYWTYMVAHGEPAYVTRERFGMHDSDDANWLNHPIYTFCRMGETSTALPRRPHRRRARGLLRPRLLHLQRRRGRAPRARQRQRQRPADRGGPARD